MPGCLSWAALRASRRNRCGVFLAGQAARPGDLDRHHPAQLDVMRPEHDSQRNRPRAAPTARTFPVGDGIARPRTRPPHRSGAGSIARPRSVPRVPAPPPSRPSRPTAVTGEKRVGKSIEGLQRRFAIGTLFDVGGDLCE